MSTHASRMRGLLCPALVLGLLWPGSERAAAETAETILIRQALEKDRSGRRRGDAELVLSAFDDDHLVVYDAAGSIDPRAWTVAHASRQDYARVLEADLRVRRYDIERAVVFINEWKDKAFVTTIDSGAVIDRAGGRSRPYVAQSLWTFHKREEDWSVTGLVTALGDTATGPAAGRVVAPEVVAFLEDEAAQWTAGSAGGIAGALEEEVVAVDCYFSSTPAKWLIIFADRDELTAWLDERLEHVRYDVHREVLHAAANGDEAVAVTRDRLTATYAQGDARVEQDRVTAWLLTRSGGRWRASWMLWLAKPYGPPGSSAATALR